jgi:hypothetical protein
MAPRRFPTAIKKAFEFAFVIETKPRKELFKKMTVSRRRAVVIESRERQRDR